MNGPCIRYISQQGDKEYTSRQLYGNKTRETYISPYKDQKGFPPKDKVLSTSPGRFGKAQLSKEKENQHSKIAPFQRSRNISVDKNEKQRSDHRSISKVNEDNRREVMKFSQIKKKLQEEMLQRERLQEVNARNQLKLSNLSEQILKLREEKKEIQKSVLQMQKVAEDNKNNLARANQTIEQLNKTVKQNRVNQKSLNTLKNLQNQIDFLQERNKKLTADNQALTRDTNCLKKEIEKLSKQCTTTTSDNYTDLVKLESATSLEGRFKQHVVSNKTQREIFLEANLHELQRKLYEKEKEMKKLQIQLNCYDRKKVLSIDDVKSKKDRQIKDLRQRYMKVTKDLKQTKDKFQINQKKTRIMKQSAFLRKVKSSKHLGMASESQQVTLELSSEP